MGSIMNIRAHIGNILKCKECLGTNTDYVMVVKALSHIIDNLDFVEKYIDDSNPFKQHFYNFFQVEVSNYEECLSVQEDIVIFFREKLLRVGINNMNAVELEVLKDFENTEQDLDSCIVEWYYEKLPLMMYKELGESIGYAGSAWKTWWDKSHKI